VFRTFGTDTDNLIWEYNRLCSGLHPCYNGKDGAPLVKLDGSQGGKDFRITERQQLGVFYRTENSSSLVIGTTKRVIKFK
jgi:hypothetical protein